MTYVAYVAYIAAENLHRAVQIASIDEEAKEEAIGLWSHMSLLSRRRR